MNIGAEVTIRSGYGYWDLTHYPWGGCFKRAVGRMPGTVAEVVDRYASGAPRKLVVTLADGRKVGVTADALEL